MAILDILTAPDPRLLAKALPIEKVDQNIRKLMDDMLETVHAKRAVGFAAIQAGIQKRVIVIDLGERNGIPFKTLRMANPELINVSSITQITQEVCLSVPGFHGNVTRPLEIKVSYLDENSQKQILSASGLLADCIQHEIDHLNGILYIEHLSSLKRNIILSRLRKDKRKQR